MPGTHIKGPTIQEIERCAKNAAEGKEPTVVKAVDRLHKWLLKAKDGEWASYDPPPSPKDRSPLTVRLHELYEKRLVLLFQQRGLDGKLQYLVCRVNADQWRAFAAMSNQAATWFDATSPAKVKGLLLGRAA